MYIESICFLFISVSSGFLSFSVSVFQEVDSEVDVLGGGIRGVLGVWALVVVLVIVVLIVIFNGVVVIRSV